MKITNETLPENKKCKHVSLTHFMRLRYCPRTLMSILARCDVSPRVGALPPQLYRRVPRELRGAVTRRFSYAIEDFLLKNRNTIYNAQQDLVFDVPEIGNLFNTKCLVLAQGTRGNGCNSWHGGFGIVCKLSFPQINAEYALKSFAPIDQNKCTHHGPYYEIPTAFMATHAEARDNCPVYMAMFADENAYMLSQWLDGVADGAVRHNQNEIFVTSDRESDRRNWRNKRRVDFGETYLTEYGIASYRVRKLYRQIKYAAHNGYSAAIDWLYVSANTLQKRKELRYAMEIAIGHAFFDDDWAVCDFVQNSTAWQMLCDKKRAQSH